MVETGHDSQYELGSVLGGKYQLLDELGAGGFGRVYLAKHLQLGTHVAIKVARVTEHSMALVREARLAAGLSSPHSVRVFDVDSTTHGPPYIVMEYLQGCTLREYLTVHGCVPLPLVIKWSQQICSALGEAHAKGLIHRDLKPANLFLVQTPGGETHVKLVDFGLAKHLPSSEESSTDSGVLAGTPAYMAPERLRTNETTVATDIWSLGVVLFEMLTQSTPFEGQTNAAMLAAIIADPPRALRDVAPGSPTGLDAVIARCLRKRPSERYGSVGELAVALASSFDDPMTEAAAPVTSARPTPEQATTAELSAAVSTASRQSSRFGRAERWVLGVSAVGLVAWFVSGTARLGETDGPDATLGQPQGGNLDPSTRRPMDAPIRSEAEPTPNLQSTLDVSRQPSPPEARPAIVDLVVAPPPPSARAEAVVTVPTKPRRDAQRLAAPAPTLSSAPTTDAPQGLILEPDF